MLIEPGPDFANIFELVAIGLRQVQRAKTGFPVAFSFSVTNDGALNGLASFNFQPRFASLSWKIRAVALFGHDAFESHLSHGFKERCAFFDKLTDTIGRVFPDRVFKPLPPPCQRLIHNRTAIQVETIEEIADGGVFGPGAFNAAFARLLHAIDYVSEV